MKITEKKVKEYLYLLIKNMKTNQIDIPVGSQVIYIKNSIMDVICCAQAQTIKEKINKNLRNKHDTRVRTEPALKPIIINHIELEVSYMTKKEVFGKVPDVDEMNIINSFLQDLGIESDRALLRSLKD